MNAKAVSWVRRYGVTRLLGSLERIEGYRITRPTVYFWLSNRTLPQPHRACALVLLSRGAITLDDVLGGRERRAERVAAERAHATTAFAVGDVVELQGNRPLQELEPGVEYTVVAILTRSTAFGVFATYMLEREVGGMRIPVDNAHLLLRRVT